MKQRFSSLDVKVIAHELANSLCSLRVANIYDLSTRIFLFKFQKPNHREQLIVDSGFRCHLTSFARATAAAPSPFVVRLRKFLKTRRVTSVKQIGTDRIIELQFSDGLYRLFLEFYAGGNIILTDGELNILALLRTVEEGAEHERLRVGLQYNLSLRQNYSGVPDLTNDRVREGLQKALDKQQDATDKKPKKKGKDALRRALAVSITELPPMLVDHAFAVTGFDPAITSDQVLQDDTLLEKLMDALNEAKRLDEEITSAEIAKGYIIAKKRPNGTQVEAPTEDGTAVEKHLYEDFHPFRPRQFESDPSVTFLEFEGFNKTVDEFFSSIEGQKLESKLLEREENAKRKLEQAQRDHDKRIGGLQQVQELNIRKAEAIQANVDRVQEATNAVNGLIEKGMDWVEIDRLIEREQKMGNPVAEMMKLPLKLHENTATLLLSEPGLGDDEEDYEGSETESEVSSDEDEEQQQRNRKDVKPVDKRLVVDIDLALTPWANAKVYFDQKKTAAVKEERTMQASQRALKSTEKKISADLKKGLKQEKEVLRPVRKQYWFEKFMYFISSDGYMILGGKDAQQNEILYKRHLKKGDIYVHADLNGAASVVIKNNPSTPDAPIPPSTLSQAGNLVVSTSSAWDSKAVMSAWWVNADQVSKIAEKTGEFLGVNIFEIRGKKNFLPPAQLLLGFAVMFQISEESKVNHQKHRLQDGAPTAKDEVPMSAADMGNEEVPEQKEDAGNAESDSDSDEDFPDAKLDSGSEDGDAESPDQEERSNPLESASGPAQAELTKGDEAQFSDPGDENEEGEDQVQETRGQQSQEPTGKAGHRHLSARERRLLRKGQLPPELAIPGTASADASGDEEAETQTAQDPPAPSQPAAASKSAPSKKQAPLPRGKRAKAKKLAAKYADQDEEDRALALRLLGAKAIGGDASSGDEKKAPEPSKEEALLAQKQRRREQHQRTQEKGKADEERRRAAQEGEVGDEDIDEETARVEQVGLDAFVGRPLPGDVLVGAIPVCAPWSALAAYKYKVKLQPGVTKKGKAVKEILSRWDSVFKVPKWTDKAEKDVERIWPREVELVKAWKETEVYGVVPVGKVRVMMGGAMAGSGGADGKKVKGKGGRGGRGKKR